MGAIAKVDTQVATGWTPEQVALIKRTICKGANDDELQLFLQQCHRTGLDPFSRQIHAVKRWDSREKREVMTMQTGIDGFRLIAERTGKYAGNDDPIYDVEGAEHPGKATVTVWKIVGGIRAPFTRSARWAEFVQTTKEGSPNRFWARMPYLMLGKVAEALALRAAFPQELSGLYTHDEMGQADTDGEIASEPARTMLLTAATTPASQPTSSASKPVNGSTLPANGVELRTRIGNYDAALAQKGTLAKGELLSHLSTVGVNHGWSDDLNTWDAIEQREFAVAETKRFVAARQAVKAQPDYDTGASAFDNALDSIDKEYHANKLIGERGEFRRKVINAVVASGAPESVAAWTVDQVIRGKQLADQYSREYLEEAQPA